MPEIAALTDAQGQFTLTVPAPGKYRIGIVSGIGPKIIEARVLPEEVARIEAQVD
jgi:hypothetical protein